MKKKVLSVLIIIIFSGLCGWLYFQSCLDAKSLPSNGSVFTIAKGDGVKTIAANLEKGGYIDSAFCFETYVWLSKTQSAMKAGDYEFNQGRSIKEIVALFASGQAVSREKGITIIEGWRLSDIGAYLKKEGLDTEGKFLPLTGSKLSDWRFSAAKPGFLAGAPANADLEGFLFPDTYRIYNDALVEEIIIKMLDNFDKKLDAQMRTDMAAQNRTIFEIVTMASILEKEVKTYDDMRIVSGVFWDRIKNGQPLQSCATLAYILGVDKPQYSAADTETDSPYNTYQNRGLPPGPICNPGLNAIKAAIYPEYTDYNYFLSRPDTGATVFSRTYDEHLSNKTKYLK